MYHECRHIMPSGKKCHSPALQNQAYCYYHNNLHRYSRPAASDNLTLFPVEDNRGIQIALTQVLTALNSPYLDTRRGGLMLYGLQIAAQLANRTSDLEPDQAVRTCDETTGAALAPEKTVCEPPRDCRNCSRQHTCEDYEDPDEDEPEEGADDSDDEKEDECDKQASDSEDGDEDEEEADEKEAALIRRAMKLLAT
jgi:hypothetical protein